MKTLFKLIFLVAVTAISTCALAQTEKAGISDTGLITIPANGALNKAFALDIAEFNFETPQDALDYLNASAMPDVALRPLLDQGIVMVYLQTKQHPDWTVDQWNQYLQTKQPATQAPIETTTN